MSSSVRSSQSARHASARHMPIAAFIYLSAAAILFALTLMNVLWTGSSADAASGVITVSTDKLVYHTGDSVVFNMILDSGGRNLSGDLVVRVYPAASYTAPNPYAAAPMSETRLHKDYNLSGQGTSSDGASLSDLKVGPGGYPYKVSLVSGNEETVTGTGWLAVVDPAAHGPLDLALLWTVGSSPQRDETGRFISTALVDRCRGNPRTPDTILQHPDFTQKFPRIKTTYAVEASLFDQLEDLAGGFELVSGEGSKSYPADSAEAEAASGCLAGLQFMAKSSNTQFISTPYSFASLPLLAKQGWDDGNGQYRIGHDILTNALSLPAVPEGAYAPGLDVTTDSLRYLAATGGEYTVLSGAARTFIQGRLPAGAPSYRVRDLSGERITAFFANDDVSAALFSDAPNPAGFMASLANAYTAGGSQPVIAASFASNPALSADQRQLVYATIDQEPWLNTLTLNEVRQKYRPNTQPVTLLRYLDPAEDYLTQTYYQKLDAVHERFEDYRLAVDSEIPEMVGLAKEMYTAESSYFIGAGARPETANQGLAYLNAIDGFTSSQFDKLGVDVSTPLLQRNSDGEATVTLVNNNPYAFNVDLSLAGDGVEFPNGSDQHLRLETGRVEIGVPFHSDGWSKIHAGVTSRGHTLVEDSAGVHLITSRGWIVIIVALAAIIGGAAYVIIVTRKRRFEGS